MLRYYALAPASPENQQYLVNRMAQEYQPVDFDNVKQCPGCGGICAKIERFCRHCGEELPQ